jgi:hypothetical protein
MYGYSLHVTPPHNENMMSNLGSSAPDFKKIEKCSLNISKKS